MEILKALRTGEIDVLIGINLLREGIDLPEVSFIADVRADRVAAVKEKLKDPNYLNDAVIKSAADKFLSALGI